ncbi:hypothetical protein V499_02427 [Pseudogymnoascus sp. VKM F-103]|nr:hypothetical protein V499_02427 [Pseudogymnoascus sp. VKM F-103]
MECHAPYPEVSCPPVAESAALALTLKSEARNGRDKAAASVPDKVVRGYWAGRGGVPLRSASHNADGDDEGFCNADVNKKE